VRLVDTSAHFVDTVSHHVETHSHLGGIGLYATEVDGGPFRDHFGVLHLVLHLVERLRTYEKIDPKG
jgi:hypothetical protein